MLQFLKIFKILSANCSCTYPGCNTIYSLKVQERRKEENVSTNFIQVTVKLYMQRWYL